MSNLVQQTIDVHGGVERWRQFREVSAHLQTGGVLWALKQQEGIVAEVDVRVGLTREWASHSPFGGAGLRTYFEPQRVAIETADGGVLEERRQPRASFTGHGLDTAWDRLQLAYFAGYAMWTYLNTPFLFAMAGVETQEIEPWSENGETWRRLRVVFPRSIATHSTLQTFYFDRESLLRRHDYDVEVAGGAPAAHYVHEYREFSGILVPTQRRVFGRNPDGTAAGEPSIVTIDLSAVHFA